MHVQLSVKILAEIQLSSSKLFIPLLIFVIFFFFVCDEMNECILSSLFMSYYVTNKWKNNNTQFKKFFISGIFYSWIFKNAMFKIMNTLGLLSPMYFFNSQSHSLCCLWLLLDDYCTYPQAYCMSSVGCWPTHSSLARASSGVRLVGFLAITLVFKSHHKFSIGFRSGL